MSAAWIRLSNLFAVIPRIRVLRAILALVWSCVSPVCLTGYISNFRQSSLPTNVIIILQICLQISPTNNLCVVNVQ